MALFTRKNDAAERDPFPFVVGMNRSGTTLLRMMLDAHPRLTIPPETHFVPDLIRSVRKDGTPEAACEYSIETLPLSVVPVTVTLRDRARWASQTAFRNSGSDSIWATSATGAS